MNLNDLPDEALLKLFSHLSPEELITTVPRVCWRWHTLHSDPRLYRSLAFILDKPDTETSVKLLQMARWLKYLELRYREDTDVILRQVGITNSVLDTLIVHFCEGKQTLAIEMERVSSSELLNVISRCPTIRHLSLNDTLCTDISFYNEIGLKLPLLRTIVFGGNTSFHQMLNSVAFQNIARNCNQLEEFRGPNTLISDEDISILCNGLRGTLSVLEINCVNCTSQFIDTVATCANLRELSLLNAIQIPDRGIFTISNLANLRGLTLWCADRVTSHGWVELFEEANIKRLTKVWLVYCENVDDEVIIALSNMADLVDLRISGANIVTTPCWIACFATPSMKKITHLHLDDCYNVNDQVVFAVVQNLRCRKQIWFVQCNNITEQCRNYFVQQMSIEDCSYRIC